MDEVLAESAVPEKIGGDETEYKIPTIKTELPEVIKPLPQNNSGDPDSNLRPSNGVVGPNSSTSSTNVQSSREALIQTAVSFLQNPKTFKASDAEKRSFLLKKGLSTSEIEQAFFIVSGSNNSSSCKPNSTSFISAQAANQNMTDFNFANTSNLVRDNPIRRRPTSTAAVIGQFSVALSLIGGLAWGLYHVIKSYLMPLFLASRQQEKRLKKQENTLHQMSLTLEAINSQLANFSCDPNVAPYKNGRIDKDKSSEILREVLEELRSLKRLTLSKDSFPPPPKIQPITIQKRNMTSSHEVDLESKNDGTVFPMSNETVMGENYFPGDGNPKQGVIISDESRNESSVGHLNGGFGDHSMNDESTEMIRDPDMNGHTGYSYQQKPVVNQTGPEND